jgi:hypothetical protein
MDTTAKQINHNYRSSIAELFQDKFFLSSGSVVRIDHRSSHRDYAICTHSNPPDDLMVFTVDGCGANCTQWNF